MQGNMHHHSQQMVDHGIEADDEECDEEECDEEMDEEDTEEEEDDYGNDEEHEEDCSEQSFGGDVDAMHYENDPSRMQHA